MEVVPTTLRDVWIVTPDINYDFRGEYVMTYNQGEFPFNFFPVEHDISTSIKNVWRGIHYSPNCWKLNQCLYGSILYYVINCDKDDKDFGKWESFPLNDKNRWQIFKHPRYGTGFLVLSDFAIFHYLQDQYYDPNRPDQKTLSLKDFDIYLPIKDPVMSSRDAGVTKFKGDE